MIQYKIFIGIQMLSNAGGLYMMAGANPSDKVASFDLDWTLIRPVRGKFPKDADDWAFLPNRITTLKQWGIGYTLAIFTNQGSGSAMAIQRVNNVVAALNREGIYPWVFAATLKNEYRKPNPGMWTVLESNRGPINKAESFYVGDAAGRPQDFARTDLEFAEAIGIKFYTPEEIFPNNTVTIPDTPTLFIATGMQGSGKSTFYEQHLQPRGWVHANQDILKTAAKVKSTVEAALASGKSVYVDATNPTAEKRREYILLAVKYQIPTLILYFVRDGFGWNNLRDKPVPTIAYNIYFKNLQEPTYELDRVPVVELA